MVMPYALPLSKPSGELALHLGAAVIYRLLVYVYTLNCNCNRNHICNPNSDRTCAPGCPVEIDGAFFFGAARPL